MRGISTLNLLSKGSLLAAVMAVSFNSFSQVCNQVGSDACTVPVLYNFDNLTVGSTGGFSGDFEYDASQSNQSNSSTYLQSTKPFATTKELITPTFVIPSSGALQLEYTFDLRGSATVSSFDVYIISPSGAELALICDNVVPQYDLGKSLGFVCASTTLGIYNLYGQTVKLKFVFTLSGSGQQTVAFDNFGLVIDGSEITLPVNYTGFTARKVSKGTQLNWNVSDEYNVSRYEVMKGTNAGDLKTIGIVFAGEQSAYTFVDEQPSAGVSFYRIRSVDIDGKFKFSTVISFANGKSAALLRAYPMPARDQVTLQHGTIDGKAQITISSEDGRIVKRQVPATGSMLTPIDLSGLKAGLYLLRLEYSNGEVATLKVVKQ